MWCLENLTQIIFFICRLARFIFVTEASTDWIDSVSYNLFIEQIFLLEEGRWWYSIHPSNQYFSSLGQISLLCFHKIRAFNDRGLFLRAQWSDLCLTGQHPLDIDLSVKDGMGIFTPWADWSLLSRVKHNATMSVLWKFCRSKNQPRYHGRNLHFTQT